MFDLSLQILLNQRSSSKNISYGIWYPSISRAHVTAARGIHFSNMGHSVARESAATNNADRVHKRLELLPEEALYLVERGAMFCWKHTMVSLPPVEPGLDEVSGAPMSVQQAFAEMIGKEDLTLERYQVGTLSSNRTLSLIVLILTRFLRI